MGSISFYETMKIEMKEAKINVWEGPQMSTYSREMAKWQTTGYGPLVSMSAVSFYPPF